MTDRPLQIIRFQCNLRGHDFAVGNIHSEFSAMEATLDAVDFDKNVNKFFVLKSSSTVDSTQQLHSYSWTSRYSSRRARTMTFRHGETQYEYRLN